MSAFFFHACLVTSELRAAATGRGCRESGTEMKRDVGVLLPTPHLWPARTVVDLFAPTKFIMDQFLYFLLWTKSHTFQSVLSRTNILFTEVHTSHFPRFPYLFCLRNVENVIDTVDSSEC